MSRRKVDRVGLQLHTRVTTTGKRGGLEACYLQLVFKLSETAKGTYCLFLAKWRGEDVAAILLFLLLLGVQIHLSSRIFSVRAR